MYTLTWLVAGGALGCAMPFLVTFILRRRDVARAGARTGAPAGTRPRGFARPGNPFAAVSICPAADSPCDAVRRLDDQRYLALRAPALPVPGCDRGRCGCRYVRHADRRASDDRRDVYSTFGGFGRSVAGERRSENRDRRRARKRPH